MTRPTARVLALLEILQAGGTRPVADLAGRLGVDERTVRRYVSHLLDLDIPVRSVRGRYGGYRLAPGYRLPPLMLTDEEGLAVLVGLLAAERAGLLGTSASAAATAAAKVRRVLPDALGRRLDALLATTSFAGPDRAVPAAETSVLLRFAEAVRDRRPVRIGYTAGNGRSTDRRVEPYGIVARSGRWYVVGADSRSGELRSFRLDRVTHAEPVEGTFDVPEGFDVAAHLAAGVVDAPRRYEVRLRVRAEAELVPARFPAGIVTVTGPPDADGWVPARLRVERLDWVPGVLAATGLDLVVEQPAELRRAVRALGERLVAAGS